MISLKKNVIKKRKGEASHVDIIFSFVLFVSFILFMLIIFNPFKVSLKTTSNLDMTEEAVLKNVSVNLSAFSIKINSDFYNANSGATCFNMTSVEHLLESSPLVMINKTGQTVNTTVQSENTYFQNFGDFYDLYYSEELSENTFIPSGCVQVGENNYQIGVIKYYEIVAYSKLVDLKNSYNGDYESLKKELGLEKDFNIFMENSPEIIFKPTKKIPGGIEVLAKSVLITILDENANLKPDIINIQVWG